jgi:hypothetical protein
MGLNLSKEGSFVGFLKDFRIWNTARSHSQVKSYASNIVPVVIELQSHAKNAEAVGKRPKRRRESGGLSGPFFDERELGVLC